MATRRLLLSFAIPIFIASDGCVNAVLCKLRHIRRASRPAQGAGSPPGVGWLVPVTRRIYDVDSYGRRRAAQLLPDPAAGRRVPPLPGVAHGHRAGLQL